MKELVEATKKLLEAAQVVVDAAMRLNLANKQFDGRQNVEGLQPHERTFINASAIADLASKSMESPLSTCEEEILLVILWRIKEEARKGFFSAIWMDLDPHGNMNGRIWHQLRILGFTVDASSVSWATGVKS